MTVIDTDYLVVGAGAAGMAFVDSLVAESDADVVLVDRRHGPGGHWNDAYPFVRLHQPSAFYGVNSRVLGNNAIDEVGRNAGLYERATAGEICDYYDAVLEEHLIPTGQVRFFGMSDYLGEAAGEHQFVSRLTGTTTTVNVRRKVIDATYFETSIPANHTPSFDVDVDAQMIPVNDLVSLSGPASGYTIIGSGKTAMDACIWLLDNGVDPGTIRWIRPREAWLLDRAFQQPLQLLTSLIEGLARTLDATAHAESVEDLFRRVEACGQLVRLDPTVEPTMYRCATVSDNEVESLRLIENVVRQGRVIHIGTDQIKLEHGTVATDRRHVHVDCSAAGLRTEPDRPMFEPGRITLQQTRTCQPAFNAALIAYIEASRDDDADKNRLCPPNRYPDTATDWIRGSLLSYRAQAAWYAEPDVTAWMEASRLDAARGINDHLDDPLMLSALGRYAENFEPAMATLDKLLPQSA